MINTRMPRNYHSTMFEGGYDPVAPCLFAHENVNAFYQDSTLARGRFLEPLASRRRGKKVVLGLITSSSPAEDKEVVKARIKGSVEVRAPAREPSIFRPCGFASCLRLAISSPRKISGRKSLSSRNAAEGGASNVAGNVAEMRDCKRLYGGHRRVAVGCVGLRIKGWPFDQPFRYLRKIESNLFRLATPAATGTIAAPCRRGCCHWNGRRQVAATFVAAATAVKLPPLLRLAPPLCRRRWKPSEWPPLPGRPPAVKLGTVTYTAEAVAAVVAAAAAVAVVLLAGGLLPRPSEYCLSAVFLPRAPRLPALVRRRSCLDRLRCAKVSQLPLTAVAVSLPRRSSIIDLR